MKIRGAIVAAACSLALVATGCGGSDDTNDGERPSAEEISKGFADIVPAGIPGAEELLACIGEGLEASELPNGVLRSIAAGDQETSIDASNEAKYTKIVEDVTDECTNEALANLDPAAGG
jgi:hypothetical protein